MVNGPANMQFFGIHECLEKAVAFKADYGKIIEGKIFPPLAGVEITIENENTSERVSVTETNHNGTYRLMNECLAQGRIPNVWKRREVVIPSKGEDKDPQLPKSYRPICLMNICAKTARENSILTAEKKGYVLSKPDSNGNFNAHKLAELIVEVLDKATNSPLQIMQALYHARNGVLLSLSDFYFSCYSGLRVAHSAFGIVTSLSGEPEENIVVEAVGLDSCAHFQEESTTDEKGYFRIRGLQPHGQGHLGEPDLTLKKAAEFCRAAEVSRLQVKALQEKSVESVKNQHEKDMVGENDFIEPSLISNQVVFVLHSACAQHRQDTQSRGVGMTSEARGTGVHLQHPPCACAL
uniref:NOMO-like ninth beta-sandwich domain-containing protein n=1 Tax=Timema cristinae TaxID=61476 RepID=A0A7R9D3X8_TIMCR|nr:unnamed protein product [Timema cristinae]